METLVRSGEQGSREELTKAFLFTDLVGSTQSWQVEPKAMAAALESHDSLLAGVFEAHGGALFKHTGDGLIAAFETTAEAVGAALEGQSGLRRLDWGSVGRRGVRMAIHVGPAYARDGDWFGPTLNRTARVLGVIEGDQIVLTAPAADQLPDGAAELIDVGLHRLRDITRPERLYAVDAEGLSTTAPKAAMAQPRRLPRLRTSIVGREADLADLVSVVRREELTTLVGPGGIGKTTLAIAAAKALAAELDCAAAFVELVELSDPTEVPRAVATALGVPLDQVADTAVAVADQIARSVSGAPVLVVLDNCEHLLDACSELADLLLEDAPDLRILATSRAPLGVAGEVTRRLAPLDVAESGAAVDLFLDRLAKAGGPTSLDRDQRKAVAELCEALDGLPLAVELAAAQAPQVGIADLTQRLKGDVSALQSGGRGRHERQQTLEATIDWGYELLPPPEQTLIRRLAVFAGSFDIDSAAMVLGFDGLSADEIRDLIPRLVSASLIVADDVWQERPYRVLETVRAFGRKRLDSAGESEAVRTAHSGFFLDRLRDLAAAAPSDFDFGVAADVVGVESDVRAAIDFAIERGEMQRLAGAFAAIAVHGVAIGWPRDELRAFDGLQGWLEDRPAELARVYFLHIRAHAALGTPGVDFRGLAARVAGLTLEGDDAVYAALADTASTWRLPAMTAEEERVTRAHCESLARWAEAHPDDQRAGGIPTVIASTLAIRAAVGGATVDRGALEKEAIKVAETIPPEMRFAAGNRASLLLRFGRTEEALAFLEAELECTLTWWDTTATELILVAASASAGRSDQALGKLRELYRRAAASGQDIFQRAVGSMAAWTAWVEGEPELASETMASCLGQGVGFHGGEAALQAYLLEQIRGELDRETRRAAIARGSQRRPLEATEHALTNLDRAPAVVDGA